MLPISTNLTNFTRPIINGPGNFTLYDYDAEVVCLAFVTCLPGAPAAMLANSLSLMQMLETIYNDYGSGGHGVRVVAVQASNVSEANVNTWLGSIPGGVSFPVVNDHPAADLWPYYNAGDGTLPQLCVIARGHMIHYGSVGLPVATDITNAIDDAVYTRDSVDIEMVMDVSGSMDGVPSGYASTKLDMAKQSATMIANFLGDHGQATDYLGLNWFDSEAHVGPFAQILGNAATLTNPGGPIDGMTASGCTAMGAGLQVALNLLGGSVAGKRVILLTDGEQNRNPMVVDVGSDHHYEIIMDSGAYCGDSLTPPHPGVDIAGVGAKIHTIGVGITAAYIPLLMNVANATNGFYLGTYDPGTDLNLIYWLDLCDCLAGGSPTVVHHNAGIYHQEECRVVERFQVSCSIRKFSAIVSWEKALEGSLTFWLRAPDGTLLDLHNEMTLHDTYAEASVYLPKEQDGVELPSIGTWEMIVGGTIKDKSARYQAIVIGEDPKIKFTFDYPRKAYDVGDIVPLQLRLEDADNKLIQADPKDIVLEWSVLPRPVSELLADYKVSERELERIMALGGKLSPLARKLEAMQIDPDMQMYLKPERKIFSLKDGTLDCRITDKGITLPIDLVEPGLNNYRITAYFEDKECGPITRVGMVSINVDPGKVSPDYSIVKPIPMDHATLFHVGLRTASNKVIGAGLDKHFAVKMGRSDLKYEVEDQLDGTYRINVPLDKKKSAKDKEQQITLTFKGETLWKGSIE